MKMRALGVLLLGCALAGEVTAEEDVQTQYRRYSSLSFAEAMICDTSACMDDARALTLRLFKPLNASASGNTRLHDALQEHYAATLSFLSTAVPDAVDTVHSYNDRREAAKRRIVAARNKVQTQLDLAE